MADPPFCIWVAGVWFGFGKIGAVDPIGLKVDRFQIKVIRPDFVGCKAPAAIYSPDAGISIVSGSE